MFRYAAVAGAEMSTSEAEGREFDIQAALRAFVAKIYPLWSVGERDTLIEAAQHKMREFADRSTLSIAMRESGLAEEDIHAFLEVFGRALSDPSERGLAVRYVIAEVVERDYGAVERQKYILAVMTDIAH